MKIKRISLILLILFIIPIIILFYLWVNYPQFPPGMEVWKGQYRNGFELSSFQPCGTEEKWWATGNLEKIFFVIPINYDITPKVNIVYIEFLGRASFKGSYGHLGVYEREIYIKDVYLVQEEIPKDCQ